MWKNFDAKVFMWDFSPSHAEMTWAQPPADTSHALHLHCSAKQVSTIPLNQSVHGISWPPCREPKIPKPSTGSFRPWNHQDLGHPPEMVSANHKRSVQKKNMMVDIRPDSWSSFERGNIRRFTFGCLQYLDQGKIWRTIAETPDMLANSDAHLRPDVGITQKSWKSTSTPRFHGDGKCPIDRDISASNMVSFHCKYWKSGKIFRKMSFPQSFGNTHLKCLHEMSSRWLIISACCVTRPLDMPKQLPGRFPPLGACPDFHI